MISSTQKFQVVDKDVKVIRKKVKNMCLRVRPPHGDVEVTVPLDKSYEEVKSFILAKQLWIEKHQERLKKYARQEELLFAGGDKLLFLGKELSLKVIASERVPRVTVDEAFLNFHIDPLMPRSHREVLLDDFYRKELKKRIVDLLEKWTKIMEISPRVIDIKKLKSKWGSCKPEDRRICLNLALIKLSEGCLEYVFVHEMVHLFVANHGPRFYALMDRYLPEWRKWKEQLKHYPLGYF
ncbi:MAG: SprT family zinc-dependent metalloprotease [Bacteroidota bacterium]